MQLIDANALMEQVKAIHKAVDTSEINTDYDTGFHSATSQVQGLIAYMPTVDAVEVVHGRWLFDRNTERYFCSACNEEALYTSKDDPIFDYDWEENLRYSHTETILEEHLTNYCPNCGAKMDGDGNGRKNRVYG